jgi:hypothetical protein
MRLDFTKREKAHPGRMVQSLAMSLCRWLNAGSLEPNGLARSGVELRVFSFFFVFCEQIVRSPSLAAGSAGVAGVMPAHAR